MRLNWLQTTGADTFIPRHCATDHSRAISSLAILSERVATARSDLRSTPSDCFRTVLIRGLCAAWYTPNREPRAEAANCCGLWSAGICGDDGEVADTDSLRSWNFAFCFDVLRLSNLTQCNVNYWFVVWSIRVVSKRSTLTHDANVKHVKDMELSDVFRCGDLEQVGARSFGLWSRFDHEELFQWN